MIKRRHSLNLLLALGLLVIIGMFILMTVQFDTIETAKYDQREHVRERKRPLNGAEFEANNGDPKRAGIFGNWPKPAANVGAEDSLQQKESDLFFKGDLTKNLKETLGSMQRIVHVDLKGSPPKIGYLKELLIYFKASF